jgi:hypothetical protein
VSPQQLQPGFAHTPPFGVSQHVSPVLQQLSPHGISPDEHWQMPSLQEAPGPQQLVPSDPVQQLNPGVQQIACPGPKQACSPAAQQVPLEGSTHFSPWPQQLFPQGTTQHLPVEASAQVSSGKQQPEPHGFLHWHADAAWLQL